MKPHCVNNGIYFTKKIQRKLQIMYTYIRFYDSECERTTRKNSKITTCWDLAIKSIKLNSNSNKKVIDVSELKKA